MADNQHLPTSYILIGSTKFDYDNIQRTSRHISQFECVQHSVHEYQNAVKNSLMFLDN